MKSSFKKFLIRYYTPFVIDFGKVFLQVCFFYFSSKIVENQFYGGIMALAIFLLWLNKILISISKNNKYRDDEFYLFPLSEIELRIMHILKFSYLILVSVVCFFGVALIYDQKTDLAPILTTLVLGFPIAILVLMEGKFNINFIRKSKKEELLTGISDFVDGGKWVVRSSLGIIAFCLLLIFDIKLNLISSIVILFLPIIITYAVIVYGIWFGGKALSLNEFVQYEDSSLKPLPFVFNGLSILALFLLISFFVNAVSSRTPASIPTIHANPSTQLRK